MTSEEKAFIRGAACALGAITRYHGADTPVEESWKACIGSWETFIAADPDQFDIDSLSPYFKPKNDD